MKLSLGAAGVSIAGADGDRLFGLVWMFVVARIQTKVHDVAVLMNGIHRSTLFAARSGT